MTAEGKTFLSRVVPWSDTSYVNIHVQSKKFNGLPGRGFKNIDHALGYAGFVGRLADTSGVYFCLSSQVTGEPAQTKQGRDYIKAVRRRENVSQLKALWFDIDVKPNAYATTEDAKAGLYKLIVEAKLPMPTAAVLSGSGGLHVYWILDTALDLDNWQPLADALANAGKTHGLMADFGVTIDAARVLRVPGTWNRKGDQNNPVQLIAMAEQDVPLADMVEALAHYRTAPSHTTSVTQQVNALGNLRTADIPAKLRMAGDTNLAAGVDAVITSIDLTSVAQQCGFVHEAIYTNGKDFRQPLWMMSIMLTLFAENSLAMAHTVSKGHPDYTPASTEEMFNRLTASKIKRNMGWPKCATIETNGSKHCASCPLRSQNKSPLNFAAPPRLAAAPPLTPHTTTVSKMHIPEPYFQGQDGSIMYTQTKDDGTQFTAAVIRYPVSDAFLLDNPWSLHFTAQVAPTRVRPIEIPLSILHSKDKLPSKLLEQGIIVSPDFVPATRSFFMAWTQRLQQVKEAVVSSSPFGWTVANGKIEGFTFAGRVWADGYDRPAAQPDATTMKQYEPRGDATHWVTAARMITDQKRPGLDSLIAASFGAPLMRFTGEYGALFAAYSPESGIGKTTTMRIAAAIWGNPKSTLQALNDTTNSATARMNVLKNLPVLWDELRGDDINKFALMAFQLTQGTGKARLNADITQRERGDWQTLLVSTSNDTLVDAISRAAKGTSAGLYRLFEVRIPPQQSGMLASEASRMVSTLNDNHGYVGLAYAQFLGANAKRIEVEVATLHDKITREVNALQQERYWVAPITIILAGAGYANELRMTDIDIPALKAYLYAALDDMRKTVKETPDTGNGKDAIAGVLQGFLGKHRSRNTIVTDVFPSGRGRPAPVKVMSDVTKLDKITVHRANDLNTIRISQAALIEYLEERGYPPTAYLKTLSDELGAIKMRAKLGAGTEVAQGVLQELVIEIDFNHAKLQGIA